MMTIISIITNTHAQFGWLLLEPVITHPSHFNDICQDGYQGDEQDTASVDIVHLQNPDDQAEKLENVEGVQSLQHKS